MSGVSIKFLLKIWKIFGNDLVMMQLPSNTPILSRNVLNYGVMTSLHWQTSLQTDNVMYLVHLVKQVSVDNVFMSKILLIAW